MIIGTMQPKATATSTIGVGNWDQFTTSFEKLVDVLVKSAPKGVVSH